METLWEWLFGTRPNETPASANTPVGDTVNWGAGEIKITYDAPKGDTKVFPATAWKPLFVPETKKAKTKPTAKKPVKLKLVAGKKNAAKKPATKLKAAAKKTAKPKKAVAKAPAKKPSPKKSK